MPDLKSTTVRRVQSEGAKWLRPMHIAELFDSHGWIIPANVARVGIYQTGPPGTCWAAYAASREE